MTTSIKKETRNNTTKDELINSLIKTNMDKAKLLGGTDPVCQICVGF
jgi:hypothetical protein